MRELVDAANISGLTKNKKFGSRSSEAWSLVQVKEIQANGNLKKAKGVYLDSFSEEFIAFSYRSDGLPISVGDFVTFRSGTISFFDTASMSVCTFKSGENIANKLAAPPEADRSRTDDRVTRILDSTAKHSRPAPGDGRKIKLPVVFSLRRFSRDDMKPNERAHFPRKKSTLDSYCAYMLPKIRRMASEGLRSSEDFAFRLNRLNIKTFAGGRWNPRLARFLLSVLGDWQQRADQKAPRTTNPSPRSPGIKTKISRAEIVEQVLARIPEILMEGNDLEQPLKRDEIVEKLSRIGRVSAR